MICPFQCGTCCDELWADVIKDFEGVPVPAGVSECPYISETGCILAREDRPVDCTSYLCEIATVFVRGEITKKRAEELMEKAQHLTPPELWQEKSA